MGGCTNQPQIYRENDKPYYRTGNKVLIALAAWSLVMFIIAKYYYVWRNKYVFASPLWMLPVSDYPRTGKTLPSGTE